MSVPSPSNRRRRRALAFEAVEDPPGLEILDPIDRRRLTLRTGAPVDPRSADSEAMQFPVDDAVRVRTASVELPNVVAVYVRDADGDHVAEVEHFGEASLPPGEYAVELTTEVKTYLRVDGSLTVDASGDHTQITFDGEQEVLVGARSRHEQPAATVTTTGHPRDVMCAVSALGSALKTTSPERSFPTLRGHPPLVELGDELDVPVSAPDTGVRIELPPELRYVYPAASLAYYLGARVVPGDRPVLTTDAGFEYDLDRPAGYERTVERTLKQVFLLDCAVRTEGLYDVPLHERAALEESIEFDAAALYDAPLAERLAAYLDHPFDAVEEFVPEWKVTTHVTPESGNVEVLPFAVNDLAVIRSDDGVTAAASSAGAEQAAVEGFLREGGFTRSAGAADAAMPEQVDPGEHDSLELAWVGDGAPVGGSKPTLAGFRNGLDRDPGTGAIDITVVCNDPSMSAERDAVSDVYGDRDQLPFDVTVRRGLSAAALRETLAEPTDFLHYIGHIDGRGFECAGGRLDAATLDAVGVDAFLLNACQSYRQGMALVEAGSIGGVVTLRDVVNRGAVAMGSTLARLLNRGFPLRAALSIASDERLVGHQYLVVGDGNLSIAQAESGTPYLCTVVDEEDGSYTLRLRGYPTDGRGMGTMFKPAVVGNEKHFLNSGEFASFRVSEPELRAFLQLEDVPVRYDGKLFWSDELVADGF